MALKGKRNSVVFDKTDKVILGTSLTGLVLVTLAAIVVEAKNVVKIIKS